MMDLNKFKTLKATLDQLSQGPTTMPARVPYPQLPKGKSSAVQRQRQWLSLLWSIDSAAENGTHGLKGLTVALGRIIVARELEDLVLNAKEHRRPPLQTVADLLWDELKPLNAAGQSMHDLVRTVSHTPSVEMSETAIFPAPWERWRFFKALGGLGAGGPWGPWRQDDNHNPVAWEPWPIIWVDNGNHSTMAALVRGGGKLKCKEAFDFTPVLEAVRTDGITWTRADDGSELGPVRSVPMAGIFLIGQRLAGISAL